MAKKRRKRKLKLRYEAVKFLSYFILILCLIIYSVHGSIKIHNFYEYRKTDEYKILSMGYTMEETQDFLKIINKDIKEFLINNSKKKVYYDIIKEKYFLSKNYLKYIDYQKNHEDIKLDKVIALVNVHASDGWYSETYNTDLSKKDLVLVNKFYKLEEGYKRDDLVPISLQYSYASNSAAEEVVNSFIQMHKEVKSKLGIHLMVNSSFRSYEDQEAIYKSFKAKGETYADSYAARPGFSEHQTGLSIDITSTAHPTINAFKESEEYQWLKDNSYKYGFILRYPEGKEDITGYNTESWHFRYVGKKVAEQIFKEGITFDEYYAYYLES